MESQALLKFVDCFQEYIQDGIDWAKVEFEDNQDCLNLFEKVQIFLVPQPLIYQVLVGNGVII